MEINEHRMKIVTLLRQLRILGLIRNKNYKLLLLIIRTEFISASDDKSITQ